MGDGSGFDPNYVANYAQQNGVPQGGGPSAPTSGDPENRPVWIGTTRREPKFYKANEWENTVGSTAGNAPPTPLPTSNRREWENSTNYDVGQTGLMGEKTLLTWIVTLRYTDPKRYQAIVDRMVAVGLLSANPNLEQVKSVWASAVDLAATLYQSQNKVTPEAAIDLLGAPSAVGGATEGKEFTQSSTRLTSEQDATVLINQAYQQAAGRSATPDEIQRFIETLHKQQRENPSVTTQTTTGTDSQSTVTEGGVNESQIAKEQAEGASDSPTYRAGQLASHFRSIIGG